MACCAVFQMPVNSSDGKLLRTENKKTERDERNEIKKKKKTHNWYQTNTDAERGKTTTLITLTATTTTKNGSVSTSDKMTERQKCNNNIGEKKIKRV